MTQYFESGGKRQFAVATLRYMCVEFRLGAQVSRELIILCTNLTVRLLPGGTVGYPAPPRLICPSVSQSVCPSVRRYVLTILRKIY
jgi:hypothetical protein